MFHLDMVTIREVVGKKNMLEVCSVLDYLIYAHVGICISPPIISFSSKEASHKSHLLLMCAFSQFKSSFNYVNPLSSFPRVMVSFEVHKIHSTKLLEILIIPLTLGLRGMERLALLHHLLFLLLQHLHHLLMLQILLG